MDDINILDVPIIGASEEQISDLVEVIELLEREAEIEVSPLIDDEVLDYQILILHIKERIMDICNFLNIHIDPDTPFPIIREFYIRLCYSGNVISASTLLSLLPNVSAEMWISIPANEDGSLDISEEKSYLINNSFQKLLLRFDVDEIKSYINGIEMEESDVLDYSVYFKTTNSMMWLLGLCLMLPEPDYEVFLLTGQSMIEEPYGLEEILNKYFRED